MIEADPSWQETEFLPHDETRSRAQVEGVVEMLAPPAKRVLDLGCGAGRVLVPLARAGHDVYGVDSDAAALRACETALAEAGSDQSAKLLRFDFTSERDWPAGPFDVILCLGNTFMTIADIDDAIALLKRIAAALAADGIFILDDLPHDLWPELTEGNWQSGISEDGSSQLVWHPHDAVFAVRTGERVDKTCWELRADDRRLRLWSSGALRLAARLAGLSEPEHRPESGLLVLRRM